jgi:ABC-type multidrug transport system ATPase subunit
LEPLAQDEFWELLLDLVGPKAEQRSTALLSSANIAEADRCRRVGMMCQGRLLACGTPWEIRRELGLEMLEVECESVEQAQAVLCKRPGVKWAELSGKRLQVALAGQESGQEVRRALQEHGLEVRSLRRIEPSLKHAYHELIWRARQS